MNWSLIGWIFGGVATLYGIKFIFTLFSSLFGKEQRKAIIAGLGDKVHEASESMSESFREKAEERKRKKEEEIKKQKEATLKVTGYLR